MKDDDSASIDNESLDDMSESEMENSTPGFQEVKGFFQTSPLQCYTPTSKFAKCLADEDEWTVSKSQRKRDLSVSPSDSSNVRNVKLKGAPKEIQQTKSVKSTKGFISRLPQVNSTKC